MLKAIAVVCCGLLTLSLIGCEPRPLYTLEYEVVSPKTVDGKRCANDCLYTKQQCEQNELSDERFCEISAEGRADREYRQYVRQQKKKGEEVHQRRRHFLETSRCHSSYMNRCNDYFAMCQRNCGGEVLVHQYCVENCELPGVMPPTVEPR